MTGIPGLQYLPGFLDPGAQQALVADVRAAVAASPLYTPTMPRTGRPFSVRMTNLGSLGWVSDISGYRYQHRHPVTGHPWAPIPARLLAIWTEVACYDFPPQACLVNHYTRSARMGLHQDKDEDALDAPVVSVSLGDTAVFRIGGIDRRDKTRSFKLSSGDVVVLAGEARLRHHGIDRIIAGSSSLLKDGGRINLTMRRVTVPDHITRNRP